MRAINQKGGILIDTVKMVSSEFNRTNHKIDRIAVKSTEYIREKRSYDDYNYGNITVRLSDSKMTVWGSLTKHFLGHNINFSLGSTKDIHDAFQKLSEELEVDLNNFFVTRVDIGRCYIMEAPVSGYLSNLISLPRHEYIYYQNGNKVFYNTIRSICLYDKAMEIDSSKKRKKYNKRYMSILGLEKSNVLRYELQIHKPNKDKKKKLQVENLMNGAVYKQIIDEYFYYFEKIKRMKELSILFEEKKGKAIERMMALYGIEKYGYGKFRDQLYEQIKLISDMNRKRGLEKFINKLDHERSSLKQVDLDPELSRAINPTIWTNEYNNYNVLIDDRQKLYYYILLLVRKEKQKDPILKLEDLSHHWNLPLFDYRYDSEEVIALIILKRLEEYTSKTISIDNFQHKIQDDGIRLAVWHMKNDSATTLTQFIKIIIDDILCEMDYPL